jgi:DNA-binding XRE family transcriptional regulator
MDQVKIGKFIAQMRKEQSLTQRQLADTIGISDKTVSEWETGNGLPEVSLMMPLCEILRINVNELLSGERLTDSDYQKKAEENMMDLIKEREESKKKIILSIIECFLTLLSGITLILLSGILEMGTWLRVLLLVIALVVIAGGIGVAVVLDMSAGTFECRKCGARFVPTPGAYIAGPHTITKRKLKCPQCGEVSYCKKRLTH